MALFELLLAFSLAHAADAPKANPETLKLVDHFLKTPTGDLPPERVPEFLAVDPAILPAKQRDKFESKRFELLALKKNADGKSKGMFRMMGRDPVAETECGAPREMQSVGPLLNMGFIEVTEDEVAYLMKETNCSECELRTEFSLTLVLTPPKKKGGKKLLHYLFHSNDPITTLLANYREGVKKTNTNFFGISAGPKCR